MSTVVSRTSATRARELLLGLVIAACSSGAATGGSGGAVATGGGGAATGGSVATGGCGPACESLPPGCCDLQTAKPVSAVCQSCYWACPAGSASCGPASFCSDAADCAADEYCDHPDDSCSGYGVCKSRPTSCAPDAHQVCTCAGTIAENECQAHAAGLDLGTACTPPAGKLACGPYYCAPSSEACAKSYASPVQYHCVAPTSPCSPLRCSCFYSQGCYNYCKVSVTGEISLSEGSGGASPCLPQDKCCDLGDGSTSTACGCGANSLCQPPGGKVSDCPPP